MKVIFANRSNCLSSPGGDTVQMLKTKEYLEKNHNIEIEICLNPDHIASVTDSPIVHIFNIQTIDETLAYIKASKTLGKKIVLSTIYWDLSHSVFTYKVFQWTNMVLGYRMSNVMKEILFKFAYLKSLFRNHEVDYYATELYCKKRQLALLEADVLLPNSLEELRILSKEFKVDYSELLSKSLIVPNAVDIEQEKTMCKDNNKDIEAIKNIGDFVLEVGRIEVNKNQLNVVKALYDLPEIPIVFIGRVNDSKVDFAYFEKLQELAKKRGNVFFANQLTQDVVFQYYKNARVHILPSFRESPGLSSLEALYFGCEIVTSSSEFCPIKFYKFDEKSHICNPYSTDSIRKAVIKAFNNPLNSFHDEDYFSNYSYERVSNITYEGYSKAIELV